MRVIVAAQAKYREAIVAAAARLFRRQGYAATGLAEILTESGAPKGSLYHYFPDGKRQVGVAAITFGGAVIAQLLEKTAVDARGPGELLRRYAAAVATDFAGSGWVAGCPIATILLEAGAEDAAMAKAGHDALCAEQAVFERSAVAAGITAERAASLAMLAIAAIEGGLIQSRAARAAAPLIGSCEIVAALFDAAMADKG